MNMYRLEWVPDVESVAPQVERRTVSSLTEIDDALDEIEQHAEKTEPPIADLSNPEGDTLSIGLGRSQSMLSWISRSLDPPYFASKGQGSTGEADYVVFYAGGQWSEFPSSNLISKESAREAVREFFVTGRLPTNVEWEEV
jgi:hypothetical protein